MKKLLFITTVLCAAACGFAGLNTFAAAAESQTLDVYPESFTRPVAFDNLNDYALNGDKCAFLDGNEVKEYDGSSLAVVPTGEKQVTAVRYDKEELLYLSDGVYFNAAGETVEFSDPVETDQFIANGWTYGFNSENLLTAVNLNEDKQTYPESFKLLRKYGGKAYAVSENVIYELDGGERNALSFEYLDFGDVERIGSSGVAEAIKAANESAPRFVALTAGEFMSEIDIDAPGETFKPVRTVTAAEGATALLLGNVGKDGGIAIVMLCGENDGKCYILRSQSVTAIDRASVEEKSLGATVTVAEGFVYSAPFVCAQTQLSAVKSGDKLAVVGEATKSANPELVRDFYKVSRTDENGDTQTGYVPFGYVSLFTISEDPPALTPDPGYSRENSIRPVVLALLVVVLVLAAVGYLIFTLTSDKNKTPKNKKNNGTEQE